MKNKKKLIAELFSKVNSAYMSRQDSTVQDRTKRTRPDKTGKNQTRPETKPDKTGQDQTRSDKTGQDRKRPDKTRGKTRQDQTKLDKTGQD